MNWFRILLLLTFYLKPYLILSSGYNLDEKGSSRMIFCPNETIPENVQIHARLFVIIGYHEFHQSSKILRHQNEHHLSIKNFKMAVQTELQYRNQHKVSSRNPIHSPTLALFYIGSVTTIALCMTEKRQLEKRKVDLCIFIGYQPNEKPLHIELEKLLTFKKYRVRQFNCQSF